MAPIGGAGGFGGGGTGVGIAAATGKLAGRLIAIGASGVGGFGGSGTVAGIGFGAGAGAGAEVTSLIFLVPAVAVGTEESDVRNSL
jgi:hypothetical protein